MKNVTFIWPAWLAMLAWLVMLMTLAWLVLSPGCTPPGPSPEQIERCKRLEAQFHKTTKANPDFAETALQLYLLTDCPEVLADLPK